jgi:P pilus assembly chaperone PapD
MGQSNDANSRPSHVVERIAPRQLGRGLALVALGLIFPLAAVHAVQIAPHVVFIDHTTRSGALYLANNGTTPEEVTIAVKFGYPDTDSVGNVYVRMIDSPDSAQPSAEGWIHVFPTRMILKPGATQTVRLLAEPPAGLPDGEYWTRLVSTARGRRSVASGADSSANASLPVETRTIIPVLYRKGAVRTGVGVGRFRAAVQEDSIVAQVRLRRQGNAAYLGTTIFRLVGGSGQEVRKWELPVAIYYQLDRRYTFPLNSLAPGRYVLHLDVTTARTDVNQINILPASPVADSTTLEVP